MEKGLEKYQKSAPLCRNGNSFTLLFSFFLGGCYSQDMVILVPVVRVSCTA